MREIVLDTETTGLSYKSGDRITEVGCTELINHVATENNLQFYCSVNRKVSEDAVRISGLTNKFLDDFPPFSEQVDKLLDFIKNDTLIIHNASFDVGFINKELSLLGMPPIKNRVIDTVSLARETLNTRVANLDYLCRRLSIDLSERDTHGALLDTKLLAEVYLELIGGKQISLNLSSKKTNNNNTNNDKNKSNLVFTKVLLGGEEKIKHKNLVTSIKNPLWQKFNY